MVPWFGLLENNMLSLVFAKNAFLNLVPVPESGSGFSFTYEARSGSG
jgi:hypothetical protein